jgi:hypothetical protein
MTSPLTLLQGLSVDGQSQSELLQASNHGLRPASQTGETFSRNGVTLAAQTLTGGQPVFTTIQLTAGTVVGAITFWSVGAANAPTHQLAGLFDVNRKPLATSADLTSAAWAANSAKKFAMVTAYTVLADGVFYVGLAESATTTIPTLAGISTVLNLALQAPPVAFTDTATAVTTAFSASAAAASAGFNPLYATVSAS